MIEWKPNAEGIGEPGSDGEHYRCMEKKIQPYEWLANDGLGAVDEYDAVELRGSFNPTVDEGEEGRGRARGARERNRDNLL